MTYKLIACDVDGTLLDRRFTFSQADKNAISNATRHGVIFSLCSGRAHRSLRSFATELGLTQQGNYIVSFNGAMIYDPFNSTVAMKENLNKTLAIEMIELCKTFNKYIEIFIYTDGDNCLIEENSLYFEQYRKASLVDWRAAPDLITAAKESAAIAKMLFVGENHILKELEIELQRLFGSSVGIFFSSDNLLEAVPKNCNKASGLRWLCRQTGIDISQTIAIGDNHNDISMIQQAGLGVAVANAVQAAKDIADYITTNDCSNGAVAEVINKFVLV